MLQKAQKWLASFLVSSLLDIHETKQVQETISKPPEEAISKPEENKETEIVKETELAKTEETNNANKESTNVEQRDEEIYRYANIEQLKRLGSLF